MVFKICNQLILYCAFVIKKHNLIISEQLYYTDNERPRITNNISIREKSFQYFYFKYSNFMSDEIKREYFEWANKLFNINQSKIEIKQNFEPQFCKNEIGFSRKGNSYQLVIGFIAGNDRIAIRLVRQIIHKVSGVRLLFDVLLCLQWK